MDLRVISKDYFNKTEEQKTEICNEVLADFLNEMLANEGTLFELRAILSNMKEISLQREEFEITEILTHLITALNEVIED